MDIQIRLMRKDDLLSVLAIQEKCYTEIEPESKEAYEKKLFMSPDTCFVAYMDKQLAAYLVAVPSLLHALPSLNATQMPISPKVDCLYLHDLAVSPEFNGKGLGAALVQRFFASLSSLGLPYAALIAIQNASGYWQRYGFRVHQPTGLSKKALLSYGSGGSLMLFKASVP